MTDSTDILLIMLAVVAGAGAFVVLVYLVWGLSDPTDKRWYRLSIATVLLQAVTLTGIHYFAGG